MVKSAFISQVKPIAIAYISDLRGKAANRWEELPDNLITMLQPLYPGINLRNVRYATNINTLHGKHITIGNQIFFTDATMDFEHADDLLTLLHELQHVRQYAQKGGVDNFLADYLMEIPFSVISNKRFDVHDVLTLESAAIEAADRNLVAAMGHDFKFTTDCTHPINVSVVFVDRTTNKWDQNSLEPLSTADKNLYLNDGSVDDPIHTNSTRYYYRAKTVDGSNLVWGGDQNIAASGQNWTGYKLIDMQGKHAGTYAVKLTCKP